MCSFEMNEVHFFMFSLTLMVSGLNPFTLRAAKTGLTILEVFYEQKHFLENI